MFKMLIEQNRLEEDALYLLPSPGGGSASKSAAPSNLSRAISWITLERLLILFLFGLLSYCISFITLQNRCAKSTTAQLLTTAQYGVDRNYMTLDHANDHLWDTLTLNHENGGVIWSSDGNTEGNETVGIISMFHQLHCLSSFRKALQAASSGEDIGKDWHDNGHWPHCFDYMRKVST